MASKHFIVTDKSGKKRLVQAKNKGAALAYVVGTEYSCEIAKTGDAVKFMQGGGAVEVADGGAPEVVEVPKDERQTEFDA